MIRELFKRSTAYFAALLVAKLASSLSVIWVARSLPPTDFGVVMLFTNYLLLSSFVGDFGLSQWFQKNAAVQPQNTLLRKMWWTRLVFVAVSMVIVGLIAGFTQAFTPWVLFLLLTAMLPSGLISVFAAYYLVNKRPVMIALNSLFGTSIILMAQYLYAGQMTISTIATAFWLAMWLTALWYVPWKKVLFSSLVSITELKQTIKESAPFAVLIVTSFAYARADSFVVNFSLGSAALGWYSSAYRYLETISILPSSLYQNLFPVASKKGAVSGKQLIKITSVMLVLGLSAGMVLFSLANILTDTILGSAYAPAADVVRIFSLATILSFVNAPLSGVVQSSRFLRKFLPWGVSNTLLNIGLNILLVPIYGFTVAAWVMVLTETSGLLINLYFARKISNDIRN